jgi:hypothetical protein
MAVDVTKPGSAQAKDTYTDATNFQVHEGHLFVLGWDRGAATNVAVYVPGGWVRAVVRDEKSS